MDTTQDTMIKGFTLDMITDEMMYLQEGGRYLWDLSPEEKEIERKGNLYYTWQRMIEWCGEDSKQAKESFNNLPDDVKKWTKGVNNKFKKPPRKVWVYQFNIQIREGLLKPEVIELISKSLQDKSNQLKP